MAATSKILYLANPRGFCAGVDRAVAIVQIALKRFGAPIFVHHEVVHNRFVIAALQKQGAVFIEDLANIPAQAVLIFSAHGVSRPIEQLAHQKGLQVLDATCPLVKKVHREVHRLHQAGFSILMIGHAGHPEVEGTMGQLEEGIYLVESLEDVAKIDLPQTTKLAYVTQTTLAVQETEAIIRALTAQFPHIMGPKQSDICYATQNRQNAAVALAKLCDLVIVVGSQNSSNSNRLREVVQQTGKPVWMVDQVDQLQATWFSQAIHIGLTAGASAPKDLVNAISYRIQAYTNATLEELPGIEEAITFALPDILRAR